MPSWSPGRRCDVGGPDEQRLAIDYRREATWDDEPDDRNPYDDGEES